MTRILMFVLLGISSIRAQDVPSAAVVRCGGPISNSVSSQVANYLVKRFDDEKTLSKNNSIGRSLLTSEVLRDWGISSEKIMIKVKVGQHFYYHAACIIKIEDEEMVLDPTVRTNGCFSLEDWKKYVWANIKRCDNTSKEAELDKTCGGDAALLARNTSWTNHLENEKKYFICKDKFAPFMCAIPPFILYRAFWQKSSPNCPSIAVIKAALNIYGVAGVFIKNGNTVTLRDGTKFEVSEQDIQKAKQHMGVIANEEYASEEFLNTVYTCYAIIAKQFAAKCESIGDCIKAPSDYDAILDYMDENGYLAKNAPIYLGLGQQKPKMLGATKHEEGVFAWGKAHCVYASDGKCDKWGKIKGFRKFNWWYYWYPKRIKLPKP